MTQEQKELLLKDLCARLPYGVKVQDTYYKSLEPNPIWLLDLNIQKVRMFADEGYQSIEYIKPYLFPLSSMTEEQKKELLELTGYEERCEESYGFDSCGVYINIVGEYDYEDGQESIILHPDDKGIDCEVNKEIVMNENKVESAGFMQMGKTISVIFNSENYEDEVELQLGDYEIEIRDGKTYAVLKKPKYPTTYEECCGILGCKANHVFTNFSYNGLGIEISDYENKIDKLLQNFRKLRYCRDAYWKIAGEEMGLDKHWEPNWSTEDERKYVIEVYCNNVRKNSQSYSNTLLAFPTTEMRDAFYDNFKDLIEQCKELL